MASILRITGCQLEVLLSHLRYRRKKKEGEWTKQYPSHLSQTQWRPLLHPTSNSSLHLIGYALGARQPGECPIAGHIVTPNNIDIFLLRKMEEEGYRGCSGQFLPQGSVGWRGKQTCLSDKCQPLLNESVESFDQSWVIHLTVLFLSFFTYKIGVYSEHFAELSSSLNKMSYSLAWCLVSNFCCCFSSDFLSKYCKDMYNDKD